MRRHLVALLVLAAAPAAAQQPVAERLHNAPPVVVRAVDSLVRLAKTDGLPSEPLILKAVEGTAKGAPPDRVVAALGALFARLGTSAAALNAGGLTSPAASEIEAGAFALSAGLDSMTVATLARNGGRANAAEVTLRVSATLRAMGVPAAEVLAAVNRALASGQPPGQLAALPGQVQSGIARGQTPAAAAAEAGRGGQGRGRATGRPPEPPGQSGRPPNRGRSRRP
jgi:hypothetical protein